MRILKKISNQFAEIVREQNIYRYLTLSETDPQKIAIRQ